LRTEKSQSSNGSENVIQEEDYGTVNFKTVDKRKKNREKKKRIQARMGEKFTMGNFI